MGTNVICPKIIQPVRWFDAQAGVFLKYHPKFCVHLENSDFKVQKDAHDGRGGDSQIDFRKI